MSAIQKLAEQEAEFPPNTVLRAVAGSLNALDDGVVVCTPRLTTWMNATEAVLIALRNAGADHHVYIHPPRQRGVIEALKRIALEDRTNEASSSTNQPLPLRNAVSVSSLPIPPRSAPEARAKLRENARNDSSVYRDPYPLSFAPKYDERHLAAVPGCITLSAFDGMPNDLECLVVNDRMLFDTGAHASCITDDLLPESFVRYLDEPVHDPYRSSVNGSVKVQVSATVVFGNQPPLNMDCVFIVHKKEAMPNQRSGIILGQSSVLNRLQYRCIPRDVLRARGETVQDGVWGDIQLEGYVNVLDDYIAF